MHFLSKKNKKGSASACPIFATYLDDSQLSSGHPLNDRHHPSNERVTQSAANLHVPNALALEVDPALTSHHARPLDPSADLPLYIQPADVYQDAETPLNKSTNRMSRYVSKLFNKKSKASQEFGSPGKAIFSGGQRTVVGLDAVDAHGHADPPHASYISIFWPRKLKAREVLYMDSAHASMEDLTWYQVPIQPGDTSGQGVRGLMRPAVSPPLSPPTSMSDADLAIPTSAISASSSSHSYRDELPLGASGKLKKAPSSKSARPHLSAPLQPASMVMIPSYQSLIEERNGLISAWLSYRTEQEERSRLQDRAISVLQSTITDLQSELMQTRRSYDTLKAILLQTTPGSA